MNWKKLRYQPIFYQIKKAIEEQLKNGKFGPDSFLPSERELASIYGVNRLTARRALIELEKEGLISSTPGKKRKVNSQRSLNICFLSWGTPKISLSIYQQIFNTISREISIVGGINLFYHGIRDINDETIPPLVKEGMADGLIIAGVISPVLSQALRRTGLPIIAVDGVINSPTENYVIGNQFLYGYEAARHLLANGHRKIVLMGEIDYKDPGFEKRVRGYKRAIFEFNEKNPSEKVKEFISVGYDYRDPDVVKNGVEKAFARWGKIDAFIGMTDDTASRIIAVLGDKELQVPADVSVMGIDGFEIGEYFSVPLTTVAQPTQEIGIQTLHSLVDLIKNKKKKMDTIKIAPRLIVRSSVAISSSESKEDGWWYPERDARWTGKDGKDAFVIIPVDDSKNNKLLVNITTFAHRYLKESPPALFMIDGQTVKSVVPDLDEPVVEIVIPHELVKGKDRVILGIRSPLFVPEKLGQGSDSRTLGVKIKEIQVLTAPKNPSDWEVSYGIWNLEKDEIKGIGTGECVVGDEKWKDYKYELQMKTDEPGKEPWSVAMVMFRYKDRGNRYYVLLHKNKTLELGKRQNWEHIPHLKDVYEVAGPFQWNDIRVEVTQASIKIYVNGEMKIDYTDPDPILEGKIGLWSNCAQSCQFKNVRVWEDRDTPEGVMNVAPTRKELYAKN